MVPRSLNKDDAVAFRIRVVLSLQDCTSRSSTSGSCFSIYDAPTEQCYAQPKGGCKTTCPDLYVKTEGVCMPSQPVLCRSRVWNDTDTFVCGEGECYGQPDGRCAASCPASHLMKELKNVCKWKDCLSRAVDEGAMYLCGEGTCYKQPNGSCGIGCPTKHTTWGAKGACVLKDCSSREIDRDAAYACGDPTCMESSSGSCELKLASSKSKGIGMPIAVLITVIVVLVGVIVAVVIGVVFICHDKKQKDGDENAKNNVSMVDNVPSDNQASQLPQWLDNQNVPNDLSAGING